MLKKLLQKIKHAKEKRWANKARYHISSLYTGEIVFYHDSTTSNGITHFQYASVKNFAIFNVLNFAEYTHFKSSQKLKEMFWADKKDYAINNLQKFEENPQMKLLMRKNHLTEDSLLSFAEIIAIENAMNKQVYCHNENDKMFY